MKLKNQVLWCFLSPQRGLLNPQIGGPLASLVSLHLHPNTPHPRPAPNLSIRTCKAQHEFTPSVYPRPPRRPPHLESVDSQARTSPSRGPKNASKQRAQRRRHPLPPILTPRKNRSRTKLRQPHEAPRCPLLGHPGCELRCEKSPFGSEEKHPA